jgi:hypothetical protein
MQQEEGGGDADPNESDEGQQAECDQFLLSVQHGDFSF